MTDVVTNYLAVDFRRIVRLTLTCFAALCEILSTRPEMQVGLEKTILIAPRYFGHQGNIRTISELFDVADSTVVACRDRVIASLMALKDTYIKWPIDQGVQRNIAAKFQEKRGFPGIIGAIDATHIEIQPPREQKVISQHNSSSRLLTRYYIF